MTMVSYAQNREDVVINRAFPDEYVGFYVDVGASDPVVDSVTKHFYDRGWEGVNAEPAALALEALKAARPRDVNLGLGLAETPGEASFYELPQQMTGCSTFSDDLAEEYRTNGWETTVRTVEMTTLEAICADHAGDRTIDFLKIDVEGDEAAVLAGANFERFRPRMIIVEATVPGTRIPSHDRWESSVLEAGYRLTLFDGLNRFYVRDEDPELAELVKVPANVLDDYIAYPCLRWRDEADEARSELQAARAELQAVRAEVDATHAALAKTNAALAPTREQLAKSQARLRDSRSELAAARQALITALPDRSLPGPAL
jgi:FkbM family methyltransferase